MATVVLPLRRQQLDTYDMYGAYYNYATISTMDVCPSGWRVPNSGTFNRIFAGVESYTTAGGSMKTGGTLEEGSGLWHSPNTGGDNALSFNAIPAGYIGYYTGGVEMGYEARFWLDNDDWQNSTYYSNRKEIQEAPVPVRCVQDIPGCTDAGMQLPETATDALSTLKVFRVHHAMTKTPDTVDDQWDFTGCNCVGWESNDPGGGGMETDAAIVPLGGVGDQCWFQKREVLAGGVLAFTIPVTKRVRNARL